MKHSPAALIIVSCFTMINGLFAQIPSEKNEYQYRMLDELVVEAKKDYFKIAGPNKFVYEVAKDTTLRDAMAIDALKKVPILNAKNNGDVSSMNGKPLVFKINGLRDPLLSNLSQALTALPANSLKSIEFKNNNTGDGKEVIEVNIITKGGLEGYRAQLTSTISDSKWKNGVWGMSKTRRLAFHGSYFNTWEWGHSSTAGNIEYRFATPELYRYETETDNSGYKVDLHNFEGGFSYDVDDNSFLRVYGGAMFKSDPHSISSSINRIFDVNDRPAIAYSNQNASRMKDAEYTVSIKYEKVYQNRQNPGHLNIGYEFYSRPFISDQSNTFKIIENNGNADLGFLNLRDSRLNVKKSYVTNTVVGEWERQLNRHFLLNVYGRIRTRSETYDNDITQGAGAGESVESEHSKTSLRERFGVLTPKAAFFTNRFEIRGGAVVQAYHHRISATGQAKNISNSNFYLLPFISAAVMTNRRLTMELAYNMGNNIPDITSMDPYIDKTIPGEVRYGNARLNPQFNHNIKFDVNGKTGRLFSGVSATASYIDDIILSYQFVDKGLLNHTFGNIANRRSAGFSGYTSGRLHRNTYVRLNATAEWTQYRSSLLGLQNQGWHAWLRARVEQELPWNVTLDMSASYNTRPVMLQGDGSYNFSYDISLFKQFLNRKLTVYIDADSFIPIRYKRTKNVYANQYSATSWNRYFHASFMLSIRYTFGKLKSRVKENSFSIENNEIKKNYDE